MNIHLPAILMFTRGTRFWHTAISVSSSFNMLQHIPDLPICAIQIVPISGILSKLNVFHPGTSADAGCGCSVSKWHAPKNASSSWSVSKWQSGFTMDSIFGHTHISLSFSIRKARLLLSSLVVGVHHLWQWIWQAILKHQRLIICASSYRKEHFHHQQGGTLCMPCDFIYN